MASFRHIRYVWPSRPLTVRTNAHVRQSDAGSSTRSDLRMVPRQPVSQRCALADCDERLGPLLRLVLDGARVPEVDLQAVDLLYQHGDRLPRRAQLLAVVGAETGTPTA